MQAPAPASPIDQIFLTALPNGISGNQLRLSLLITPSLLTGTLAYPFLDWPEYARTLTFTATFTDPAPTYAPKASDIPLVNDPDSVSPMRPKSLWREIFEGTSSVEGRKGFRKLHQSWRLSHDITGLHEKSELNLLAHAYDQISASRNIAPDASLDSLKSRTAPPPLFLHPDFNTGTQSDLVPRIDDRAKIDIDAKSGNAFTSDLYNVLQTVATNPNAAQSDFRTIVLKRFRYAVSTLEKWGGARLSAAAYCAAFVSCVNATIPLSSGEPTLAAAAQKVDGWFATGATEFSASYSEYPDIPKHLHLILFHHRSTTKRKPQIDQPDFHQLLGMVHNYPAMMRQLHLVYDFVLPQPALTGNFVISIALAQGVRSLSGGLIKNPIKVVSCNTLCTLQDGQFFATPARTSKPNDALIKNGLLNLQAPDASSQASDPSSKRNRFCLVPEAADSQALKNTRQTHNQARATRYATSAPHALNAPATQNETPHDSVNTPSATTNPVSAPAAPRSVGLALFDRDRLVTLENQAAKIPDSGSSPVSRPPDFYAEDIILGYRVDVLYKGKFYSLCQRKSIYNIFVPRQAQDDTNPIDTWAPYTKMEKSADEGFTSFGATETPLTDQGSTDDPLETQTQVHQSVFTWIGWSLSVPAPSFPQMNRNRETFVPNQDSSSNHLAIKPKYWVSPHQLPPLRFNTDYTIRCRMVDLAGNGPPSSLDPDNSLYADCTLAPSTKFSRHEPIRAPQFLLIAPINRNDEPGTHIDRMVARDSDHESSRILVPPRESLRLAELLGYLDTPKLPQSAFAYQQLEEDGAFPTVARAKDKGWIRGKADNPSDNDPIFLPMKEGIELRNRYYPDPWANFIRIQPFVVSDDPAVSTVGDPFWIQVTSHEEGWPQRLATRVRLIPSDDQDVPPKIESDQFALAEPGFGPLPMPAIRVTLPKACTVILRISSAACNRDAPADVRDYSVHLTHLFDQLGKNRTVFDSIAPKGSESALHALSSSITRNQIAETPFLGPCTFVDGSVDLSTPKRMMTLVHAVKKPLAAPKFSDDGLDVTREVGKPEALVKGQLGAHWLSTAKITCYANWSDRVDDLNLTGERPQPNPHNEVAFAITLKDLISDKRSEPTRLRDLPAPLYHQFADTRAHAVTYTLSASTNFREYFPLADQQPDPHASAFEISDRHVKFVKIVQSSARPPAPSIVYLIPAFIWQETYDHVKKVWYQGRTVVMRAYFERPFLVSGDNETVAVALVDPKSQVPPASQTFVSRWGADPTRGITAPILQNELSDDNLNEPGLSIQPAFLKEGGTARFKPCILQYSSERKLWFADIPINTQNANSPFVRLALARWNQDALSGDPTNECRCSQMVFTEFMQVAADRWVSIQKKSSSTFSVAISGTFPGKNPQNPISITLQKRWYPLGKDTGWRTVGWTEEPKYSFHPADDTSAGVACWTADLDTSHSTYSAKYRLLLTEQEIPGQDCRKSLSMFIDLP